MAKFSSFAFQGRNKYGNKRVGSHASKKEHYRAAELRMMQRAGLISDLREQVKYLLIPAQYGECGKDFKIVLHVSFSNVLVPTSQTLFTQTMRQDKQL